MDEKLTRRLMDTYPSLFRGPFYFEHNDGWFSLINDLCAVLHTYNQREESRVAAILQRNKAIENAKNGNWELFENLHKYHSEFSREALRSVFASEPVQDESTLQLNLITLSQVKEKFGTLRFYCNGATEAALGAIDLAETMSSTICETCGAPGQLTGTGWLFTACDEHVKK